MKLIHIFSIAPFAPLVAALLVGFFGKNQDGVMTHHGSNIHIHGLLDIDGATATGHLDSVEFTNGAKLYLPDL